jgi:phage anti-repressor protein
MNELIKVSNEGRVTARELYEFLELASSQFARWVKTNIEQNEFYQEGVDWQGFDIVSNGNETKDYHLTIDFAKHLCMLSRTERGKQARSYFVEVEKRFKDGYIAQPMSQIEVLAQATQIMLEQDKALKQLQADQTKQRATLTLLTTRIDTLDRVEVRGDEQQQLNKMVQKHARATGITYSKAWKEFKQAYNTAYHTNLTRLMDEYKEKYGLRNLTLPQYLSLTGKILDALRVADKMLNTARAM